MLICGCRGKGGWAEKKRVKSDYFNTSRYFKDSGLLGLYFIVLSPLWSFNGKERIPPPTLSCTTKSRTELVLNKKHTWLWHLCFRGSYFVLSWNAHFCHLLSYRQGSHRHISIWVQANIFKDVKGTSWKDTKLSVQHILFPMWSNGAK